MKGKMVLLLTALAGLVGLMIYTHSGDSDVRISALPGPEGGFNAKPSARNRSTVAGNVAEQIATAEPPSGTTNWFTAWEKDGPPKLTVEQAEAYVQQNKRSAESLIAAAAASGDRKFLLEAMEKYPNDPRVALRAAFSSGPDDSDEDIKKNRRQWLDAFKQSAPDNALADYLSAGEHFKSGEKDLALAELEAASRKQMQDYSLEYMLSSEEAYRDAGYSEVQAKFAAMSGLLLPQLAPLKGVGLSLIDLANSYRQAGEGGMADAALQMAINLGGRLNNNDSLTLIGPLVGMAIERKAFAAMDPNAPYGNSGQTVQHQIDLLQQQREAIRDLNRQAWPLLPSLPDQALLGYFERERIVGERAALQWVLSRYGSN